MSIVHFPKQELYLSWWFNHTTTEIDELLFGGAAGGGKTVIGCDAIILAALRYPGSKWAIGRARLSILKETTMATFYDRCTAMGLEKGTHYTVNDQRNYVKFYNKSIVLMKDLFAYPSDKDFDRLGSLEICGGFIDELPQVVFRAFSVFGSRMRYKLNEWCECGELNKYNKVVDRDSNDEPVSWLCRSCGEVNTGLKPKLGAGCNPSRGWVYSEFYKPKIEKKLPRNRAMIFARVTDNYKIPKAYVNKLNRLPKIDRERLLLGNWEYSDSSNLFDVKAVQDFLTSERKAVKGRYFMSVDVARMGKDKSIIMVMSSNKSIKAVFKFEKIKTDKLAGKIRKVAELFDIDEYDIAIDTDGVGGGVADHFDGVTEIVNNSSPLNGENYANLKTQLFCKLADEINDGELGVEKGVFSDSQALQVAKELEPIKRTNIDKDERIKITPKAELKQILQGSPDYADALAYMMIFIVEDRMNDEYETIT